MIEALLLRVPTGAHSGQFLGLVGKVGLQLSKALD
ncbi:unannotated protein [freshwater metagenome]|uniref:Unannotated protein n=1 Tax=freshwater metagenome TaxID=449393 RepID=A0A6J7BTF5_9ZZZZ